MMPRQATLGTIALSLCTLLATLSLPSEADACSALPCDRGFFDYDQKMVPAELDAFVWHPGDHYLFEGEITENDVVLEDLQTGAEVPVELDTNPSSHIGYLVRLQAPLSPGTAYRFSGLDLCERDEDAPRDTWRSETVFATACEPQTLPTKLGELRTGPNFTGSLSVATSDGSCAATLDTSQMRIWLDPDDEALRWMPVMHFYTKIDDHDWFPSHHITDPRSPRGESWQGRGRDLLYALCEEPDGSIDYQLTTDRSHQVSMLARIPGTDFEMQTEPIEVTLDCGAPPAEQADEGYPFPEYDGWPEQGCDVSLEAEQNSDDVGIPDAGDSTDAGDSGDIHTHGDTGDQHDAGDLGDTHGGGPIDGVLHDGEKEGCAGGTFYCTAGGEPDPSGAAYLLLVAFGLVVIRRR